MEKLGKIRRSLTIVIGYIAMCVWIVYTYILIREALPNYWVGALILIGVGWVVLIFYPVTEYGYRKTFRRVSIINLMFWIPIAIVSILYWVRQIPFELFVGVNAALIMGDLAFYPLIIKVYYFIERNDLEVPGFYTINLLLSILEAASGLLFGASLYIFIIL